MDKGPFFDVEAFLQAGDFKEALSVLKRASGSAPPWEVFLWLGRIEEQRGRLAQAEQAYRKALSADPKAASLEIEFARFLIGRSRFEDAAPRLLRALTLGGAAGTVQLTLGRVYGQLGRHEEAERSFLLAMSAEPASAQPRVELSQLLQAMGRHDEAQRVMEDAAVKAAGDIPALLEGTGSLLALMECGIYRKTFLAEILKKGEGNDRVEAALRSMLKGGSRVASASILLADVLVARERLAAAEAELEAAFLPGGRAAETSRIEVLLKLIERGRYGPRLEKAVLGCLARAEVGEKIVLDWPQIFSALMCARRYLEAFRLGEAILDKFGRFESPGQLMWPWWRMIRRAVAEDRFIDLELKRIRAAGRSGKYPHWFAYYRAILLCDVSHNNNEKAMLEYERIKDLDAERYSWMLQSFVLVKLGLLDFVGAIEISRDILSRAPSHWWVRCRMAEAYMAGGDVPQGLREFEEAGRICGPNLKGEVLTWHGEVLLWLGEYAEALEKLDAAVALGAKTFVFGWRGAARFKLGDFDKALEDLNYAVELDSKDFEARGWRAEAYRVLGRHAEAIEDIKYVIDNGPANYWSHLNRALLRDILDDGRGMAADLEQAPKEMLALIMKKLKITRKNGRLTRAEMRKILTSGLDWAKGIRRWEAYVQPIWMERLP